MFAILATLVVLGIALAAAAALAGGAALAPLLAAGAIAGVAIGLSARRQGRPPLDRGH